MKQIGPVIVMDPWEACVARKIIQEAFREGLIREQQQKKGSWHFTCSDVEAAEEVARRIGERLASISEAA